MMMMTMACCLKSHTDGDMAHFHQGHLDFIFASKSFPHIDNDAHDGDDGDGDYGDDDQQSAYI